MTRLSWDKLLSPLRVRPDQSKPVQQDFRNAFEKDYHRIIQSASFRRLQDKTQAFPLDRSDFVRTRLTHSIETSSLAKSLGQHVCQSLYNLNMEPLPTKAQTAQISDLLLCAGLAHDIGNPPFGHYGEMTIRLWFKNNLNKLFFKNRPITDCLNEQMLMDLYNFEGNAQVLRVLSKLHFLVDKYGMNLTLSLLATLIKYPVSSLHIERNSDDIRKKKLGYYYADRALFKKIIDATGQYELNADESLTINIDNPDHGQLHFLDPLTFDVCRHPLTFLLEAADDIAYKTADLEDAFKKGWFSFGQLLDALNEPLKGVDMIDPIWDVYREVVDMLSKNYAHAKEKHLPNPEEYAIQNWCISIQSLCVNYACETFVSNYEAIMNGQYQKDLLSSSPIGKVMDTIYAFEFDYVFSSRKIVQMELAANNIIGGLMDHFVKACIHFDTDETMNPVDQRLMSIISENYLQSYQEAKKDASEEEKLYLRLLLVSDYISGMTDSFAKNLYQEMSGVDSIF